MNKLLAGAIIMATAFTASAADGEPAQEWDKVFPLSDKVRHEKVSFRNHFGITLAGDLYAPKDAAPGAKLPGIIVGGPFGAVKEQVSGLYAMSLAERGFVTVAADPSFMGESGGEPRGVNSPDLNVEDFQTGLDYLATRPDVDADRLGLVGICGWGGFGLQTAQIDTRVKATAIITMYDMTRVYANDYDDANDSEAARFAKRKALSDQRTADARSGSYARVSPLPNAEDLTADSPQFLKDYVDFYKTPRGYHRRSIGSNGGWLAQTFTSLQNTRILDFAREIRCPVLLVHGEKAHSRYFAEGAFQQMTGEKPVFAPGEFSCKRGNKELLLVPGAAHCDLYDERAGVIPWDRLDAFFKENLAPARKTLVAYFSWSGNTKAAAQYIAGKTGADLFEIVPEKPYPTDYKPCTEVAKAEKEANARPAIKGKVENLAQYDTVFVGAPVWWYTGPMPLFTFLEGHDLKGKTVIPFCTAYSGPSATLDDIAKATPGSAHKDGICIVTQELAGKGMEEKHSRIDEWLKNIGY